MQYVTVQYVTVWCNIARYSTAQCSTVQRNIAQSPRQFDLENMKEVKDKLNYSKIQIKSLLSSAKQC